MSLVASLNVGVSALRSFSEGIQVISNNISNVSTVAYKSSHANYSDTFSNLLRPLVPGETGIGAAINPTQIGGGVQVQTVTAQFTQGTVSNTGSNADLAIAGPGYFRVKDPISGRAFVTRAGNFRFDANGYLVTQEGYRVQGTSGAKTKVAFNPATGDYDVKTSASNPVKVTAVRASVNPNVLQGVDTSKLSVGMVLHSATELKPFGATIAKGSDSAVLELGSSDMNKLAVGMPFSGPGIPDGTFIESVTPATKTVTLSQSAASTSTISDLFTVPQWTVGNTSSNANNHAVITKISGGTVTLSNMDGVNVYDRPLDFTFMTPRTVKLTASNLSAVTVPVGGAVNAVTPAAAFNLTNVIAGGYEATISIGDAANLRVGMTVTTTNYPVGTTVVGFTNTGSATTQTVRFSAPANAGSPATDAITAYQNDGVLYTGDDFSVTNVITGQNTATVAATGLARLAVGMTVSLTNFPAGTRVTKIDTATNTVTFSNNATSGTAAAPATDAITAISRRVYAVNVEDSSAVVDGMVAKITDPITQAVSYAGVTVDRSAATPRVFLDFSAFGVDYGISDDQTVGALTGNKDLTDGVNKEPITSNYTGSFGVDFETNRATDWYSAASQISDVRISFDERSDYELVNMNGGALSSNLLARAQEGAPKVKTFAVSTNGSILATLSNGQTFTTGQVLLQDFLDSGALIREGGNLFSGMELAGERNVVKWSNLTVDNVSQVTAGKSGLGAIQGSALELSNVDIGEEFAKMITTQRSFQAGSRVITVSDQMLEEVVNLKR